jgi:hypothetical protein
MDYEPPCVRIYSRSLPLPIIFLIQCVLLTCLLHTEINWANYRMECEPPSTAGLGITHNSQPGVQANGWDPCRILYYLLRNCSIPGFIDASQTLHANTRVRTMVLFGTLPIARFGSSFNSSQYLPSQAALLFNGGRHSHPSALSNGHQPQEYASFSLRSQYSFFKRRRLGRPVYSLSSLIEAIRAISHQFVQRQTAIRWLEWLHRKLSIGGRAGSTRA